jgi:hypothetical protein
VTDSLIGLVKGQWATAPIWAEIGGSPPGPTFTPTFTGLAPDAVREQPGPQLSMFLYHVEPDIARESLFWQSQILSQPQGQPTRFLPVALDLYYLLYAYSEASYAEEQEAMSVALRIFHANPIVRSAPGTSPPWELTLTVERRSYDELSFLWQATTAPLRASLVLRAAVVLIDPDSMPAPAPETTSVSVVGVGPATLPVAGDYPVLFGTSREGSYVGPTGLAVSFSASPASVAAGQSATLLGSNLGINGVSDNVYLLPPGGGPEVTVTPWALTAQSSATKFALAFPAAGQTPAPNPPTPDPGVYQLRVGSGELGSAGVTRSGSTPVSIAAYVNPSGGPVLTGTGPFTVSGAGFLPGSTEVLVGTVALTAATTTPNPGQLSIESSGTTFSFAPPAGLAGTVLPLRVRVNGVESDPALWVQP